MTDRGAVRIGPVSLTSTGGVHRVVADVDGALAWIESSDTMPLASPEAFGAAFLLPALHHRRTLVISDPVDALWLENAGRLMEVLRGWWRYPVLPPKAERRSAAEGPRAGAVALFFSGGVDSFYSLLRCGIEPDRLVAVHGFDIHHEDEERMAAVASITRDVAKEYGRRAVVLRTNLRAHPLMAAVPWERAHGGTLAAIGHVLDDGVSEVVISSSIAMDRMRAWGSHWKIDHLHSSSAVRFRQLGMELRRVDKLRRIAIEPLLQRHLRVCWQNRSTTPNCSHCQKCLLTRLVLADCGVLDAYQTLDGTATLARDVNAFGKYGDRLNALGEVAASRTLDPEIRRAAQGLLRRSRHAQHPLVRARRAVLRRVMQWWEGARA